ncbi:FHA domain-containing protein [Arthrobacter sp. zg-ZUI100]|uniref:FHA domain-containing protein n=1 Tax=Arthrobacter jiangjiafuii TaxID=2817475 RepID=A0A975M745_9MICC|nr:FHA domain-containing protein [Arthrobacter jiangjiafuii]MBP3036878.1 FHA domain-containing protein [Arthrobacter jiangjiafuii]MBP3044236.1 FHA domain-containing protein [Arthrobacter jiangjiafuii]QWC11198.1 FHA domain-containing protein [Arthrobacter jiangjiafuii]
MAGEHNSVGQAGNRHEPATQDTTSISLPPQGDATSVEPKLSADERAAVAALPAGSALLIAHTGPNTGARFLLDQDVTTAGRHPNADVFLDDVTVSRKHVEFRRTAEGFRVVDSMSLNGTYVNNDRVDTLLLRTGSEVQIGKFRLTFYAARPAAHRA